MAPWLLSRLKSFLLYFAVVKTPLFLFCDAKVGTFFLLTNFLLKLFLIFIFGSWTDKIDVMTDNNVGIYLNLDNFL